MTTSEQKSAKLEVVREETLLDQRIKQRQQETSISMLKGHSTIDEGKVMKAREDYAVNLRNSKRQVKLNSKRKDFIQNVFKRTVENTAHILGSNIKVEQTIFDSDCAIQTLQYAATLQPDSPVLKQILIQLREFTINCCELQDYQKFLSDKQSGFILVQMLGSPNTSVENLMQIIWILLNMNCGHGIGSQMIYEYNILTEIASLYTRYFLQPQESGQINLTSIELNLLEQLLWLTCNITADSSDSAILSLKAKFHKILSIIVTNFHQCLDFPTWRVIYWLAHILSKQISHTQQAEDYDPFNKLIVLYLEEAMSTIPSSVDSKEEAKTIKQMRSDALCVMKNLCCHTTKEQIKIIVANDTAFHFLLSLLALREQDFYEDIMKIFGDMLAQDDQIGKRLVDNHNLLGHFESVLTFGSNDAKCATFWAMCNLVVDSEELCHKVIDSEFLFQKIMVNAHSKKFSLKQEAIWTLSNVCYKVGDQAKIEILIKRDILSLINQILIDQEGGNIMLLAMTCLQSLLQKSTQAQEVFYMLDGHETLHALNLSQYYEVSVMASNLVEQYYTLEEDMQQSLGIQGQFMI